MNVIKKRIFQFDDFSFSSTFHQVFSFLAHYLNNFFVFLPNTFFRCVKILVPVSLIHVIILRRNIKNIQRCGDQDETSVLSTIFSFFVQDYFAMRQNSLIFGIAHATRTPTGKLTLRQKRVCREKGGKNGKKHVLLGRTTKRFGPNTAFPCVLRTMLLIRYTYVQVDVEINKPCGRY